MIRRPDSLFHETFYVSRHHWRSYVASAATGSEVLSLLTDDRFKPDPLPARHIWDEFVLSFTGIIDESVLRHFRNPEPLNPFSVLVEESLIQNFSAITPCGLSFLRQALFAKLEQNIIDNTLRALLVRQGQLSGAEPEIQSSIQNILGLPADPPSQITQNISDEQLRFLLSLDRLPIKYLQLILDGPASNRPDLVLEAINHPDLPEKNILSIIPQIAETHLEKYLPSLCVNPRFSRSPSIVKELFAYLKDPFLRYLLFTHAPLNLRHLAKNSNLTLPPEEAFGVLSNALAWHLDALPNPWIAAALTVQDKEARLGITKFLNQVKSANHPTSPIDTPVTFDSFSPSLDALARRVRTNGPEDNLALLTPANIKTLGENSNQVYVCRRTISSFVFKFAKVIDERHVTLGLSTPLELHEWIEIVRYNATAFTAAARSTLAEYALEQVRDNSYYGDTYKLLGIMLDKGMISGFDDNIQSIISLIIKDASSVPTATSHVYSSILIAIPDLDPIKRLKLLDIYRSSPVPENSAYNLFLDLWNTPYLTQSDRSKVLAGLQGRSESLARRPYSP